MKLVLYEHYCSECTTKRKTCWKLELLTMNNDDEKGSVVSVESFYCHCRYFINLSLPMRGNMFHTTYVKWCYNVLNAKEIHIKFFLLCVHQNWERYCVYKLFGISIIGTSSWSLMWIIFLHQFRQRLLTSWFEFLTEDIKRC